MSQNFKPIFDYLDNMKVELKADIIAAVDLKTDKIQSTLDSLAKDDLIRNEAQNNRIKKLETWIKPVGKKLQMPLVN